MIAIIDADIVGKTRHRFPNLACMKISSYYKSLGEKTVLKLDYENLGIYDKVFICKVFTNTEIPGEPEDKTNKCVDTIAEWYADNEFLKQPNIEYGGTGFFYDEAPPLPSEIEHCMPDYHFYDDWVESMLAKGGKRENFTYYLDYSIGFLTRGCFRGCTFCVNRNSKASVPASNIMEFYDPDRPKLCFLDDNFFACSKWQAIIEEVKSIGVKFQFKQGLDERLLTEDKVHELISWNYDGDYIFAFDDWNDRGLIESKLQMIFRLYPDFKKRLKFYVFCGFDRSDKYHADFWAKDIEKVFGRCFLLAKYSALPYIMRHENAYKSPLASVYTTLASWCNQPSFFKKMTFRQYAIGRGMSNENYKIYKNRPIDYLSDGHRKGSCWRSMEDFEKQYPDIARKYFDTCGDNLLEYGNGRKEVSP